MSIVLTFQHGINKLFLLVPLIITMYTTFKASYSTLIYNDYKCINR